MFSNQQIARVMQRAALSDWLLVAIALGAVICMILAVNSLPVPQ